MATKQSLYEKHLVISPVDLDRDGIAQSQHTTADTAMTLNGTLVSGGAYTAADGGTSCKCGHLIGVYSSSNIASDVFTIVGTDPQGQALTETVTGVNNSTVFTTKYFYTVTSVTNNTTEGTANVEVGIGSTLATNLIPIEARSNFAVGINVVSAGTITHLVQQTYDDIHATLLDAPNMTLDWQDHTSWTGGKTATQSGALTTPVTAIRLITSSYSSGSYTLRFNVIQNKAAV